MRCSIGLPGMLQMFTTTCNRMDASLTWFSYNTYVPNAEPLLHLGTSCKHQEAVGFPSNAAVGPMQSSSSMEEVRFSHCAYLQFHWNLHLSFNKPSSKLSLWWFSAITIKCLCQLCWSMQQSVRLVTWGTTSFSMGFWQQLLAWFSLKSW